MPIYEEQFGDIFGYKADVICCGVDDVGSTKGLCGKFCNKFEGFEDWYLDSCKKEMFLTSSLLTKTFKLNNLSMMVAMIHCKDWEGCCLPKSLKLGLFELKEILLCLDEDATVVMPPIGYTSKHYSLTKNQIKGIIREVFWNIPCKIVLFNFEN